MTKNTILVVASSPGFPHGVMDHVQDIAKVSNHQVYQGEDADHGALPPPPLSGSEEREGDKDLEKASFEIDFSVCLCANA